MFTRTFTHKEFLEYKKKEMYKRNILAFSIAAINFLNPVIAVADVDISKLDDLGTKFLNTIRGGGYWIILIIAVADVIKTAMKGGKNEIGNTIIKYLLIYASLYILPLLFDMIREVFIWFGRNFY